MELKNSQYIECFLNFMRQANEQYKISKNNEMEQNAMTQDILHYLELEELSYHERAKLGTELAEVRKKRRKYKDSVEELLPVVKFMTENKNLINGLEQLLGAVRKEEKYHDNRSYHPKVKNRKE